MARRISRGKRRSKQRGENSMAKQWQQLSKITFISGNAEKRRNGGIITRSRIARSRMRRARAPRLLARASAHHMASSSIISSSSIIALSSSYHRYCCVTMRFSPLLAALFAAHKRSIRVRAAYNARASMRAAARWHIFQLSSA